MPYIGRRELREIGAVGRELAADYATKGKGELPVDRIVYGYITGKYGYTQRQVAIKSEGKWKRIDYLHGGKKSGTFIELVVRRRGQEWQASQNDSELNKLIRAHGRVRALVVVDISKLHPVPEAKMRENFGAWVATAGRFTRRHVTVVYAGADGEYSFGMKTGTTGAITVSDT